MKVDRYIHALAAEFGLTVHKHDRGKHHKVTYKRPDGATMMVLFSNSESDWRGPLNTKARIKRWLRT